MPSAAARANQFFSEDPAAVEKFSRPSVSFAKVSPSTKKTILLAKKATMASVARDEPTHNANPSPRLSRDGCSWSSEGEVEVSSVNFFSA